MKFKKQMVIAAAALVLVLILSGCSMFGSKANDDTSEIAGDYVQSDQSNDAMALFSHINIKADGTANIYSANDPIGQITEPEIPAADPGPAPSDDPNADPSADRELERGRPENNLPISFDKRAGEATFDNGNGVIYKLVLDENEVGEKIMTVYFNDNKEPVQTLVLKK